MAYEDLMQKHGFIPRNHIAPVFFPVSIQSIYDGRGQVVPGHKRVQRDDTGDTLAVHSDKYALVPYEERFKLFEDAIDASQIPTDGMQVGTDMWDNGARIFRQYLFPATKMPIEVHGRLHELCLRIAMFDSYDGSSAFIGRSGYFNFACANEAFVGKSLLDVRFKHTGAMDERVKLAAKNLAEVGSTFIEDMRRIAAWPKIPVDPAEAMALVQKMPQARESLSHELTAKFALEEGDNLFDLSQTLTAWATHGIPKKVAAQRQKRVQDLIEGVDWKEVEAREPETVF